MKIAVFGMGYVGVVTSACLARDGHIVIGVDPNESKTDLVKQGKSPIIEPGLEDLIGEAVAENRLSATGDYRSPVAEAELILVCVGTPGAANGSLDLGFVRRVCEQIGGELRHSDQYKVVAIRSTMLPGSMESIVIPTLQEASGMRVGQEFGVCINPEFLREGSAIFDYDNPPKTVIGSDESRSADILATIYEKLTAPLIVTDLKTAEMVKYADNSWHALKVTFANELGRLCKEMGVDSRTLMKLFCEDTKLNISSSYLRPGYAFGGSCLPKDLRALTYNGKQLDVDTPMLSAILPSNQCQINVACELVEATGRKRIGILGLSFKEGTDDLRESPIVTLVEYLIGKGYELSIYDRNVKLASLVGANRDYILNRIPHIGRLLVDDPAMLIDEADVLVLATGEREFGSLVTEKGPDKIVIDLVGIWDLSTRVAASYQGIGW